jgi:hypothetical protein
LLDIPPIYPWRFRFGNASLSIVDVLPFQPNADQTDGSRGVESGDATQQLTRSSLMLFNDTCHWSLPVTLPRAQAGPSISN